MKANLMSFAWAVHVIDIDAALPGAGLAAIGKYLVVVTRVGRCPDQGKRPGPVLFDQALQLFPFRPGPASEQLIAQRDEMEDGHPYEDPSKIPWR